MDTEKLAHEEALRIAKASMSEDEITDKMIRILATTFKIGFNTGVEKIKEKAVEAYKDTCGAYLPGNYCAHYADAGKCCCDELEEFQDSISI
jgi:hypothetical protein